MEKAFPSGSVKGVWCVWGAWSGAPSWGHWDRRHREEAAGPPAAPPGRSVGWAAGVLFGWDSFPSVSFSGARFRGSGPSRATGLHPGRMATQAGFGKTPIGAVAGRLLGAGRAPSQAQPSSSWQPTLWFGAQTTAFREVLPPPLPPSLASSSPPPPPPSLSLLPLLFPQSLQLPALPACPDFWT